MSVEDISASAPAASAQRRLIRAVPYTESEAERWDEFVAGAFAATFLHTRKFLSYHGNRFQDASLLLENEKGELAGVLAAAADPDNPKEVISHPGITYGGVLHAGALRGERMIEAFEAARNCWLGQGFQTLRYKPVPHIYHRVPSGDDLYALFRLKAKRYRCDLSCSVDLSGRLRPSHGHIRGARQAQKQGVVVNEGAERAAQLWQVLEENLAEKHGARPVHTLAEIQHLHSLFPANIQFVTGVREGQVIAGVVLFVTPRVVHAQYIASRAAAAKTYALDLVLEHCIRGAAAQGARYFDFGISNERQGQYLNTGLYQFKAEFGGGGVVHECYELDLRRPECAGNDA